MRSRAGSTVKFHCQACGSVIDGEHICEGTTIVVTDLEVDSIAATGTQRETLHRKGFHESFGPYGVHYYHHPMHGLLFLYPGMFSGTVNAGGKPLEEFLNSLPDSSYTDIGGEEEPPHLTRCDVYGEVGTLLPDENHPFPHKLECPQRVSVKTESQIH